MQMDFANIAALGHSIGGAAAVLAAHNATEIKTAVNMDGDLLESSSKASPKAAVLFLNQLPAGFENLSFNDMKKDTTKGWRYQQMVKATSESVSGYFISISGIYHSNYQDYALIPTLIPDNIKSWRLGPINGKQGLGLISKTLIAYLNDMLKARKSNWQKLNEKHSNIRVVSIK